MARARQPERANRPRPPFPAHTNGTCARQPERANLSIREDKRRGVFVEGLSEWVVRSPAEIYGLMHRGGQVR
jgi:hypothetical protein